VVRDSIGDSFVLIYNTGEALLQPHQPLPPSNEMPLEFVNFRLFEKDLINKYLQKIPKITSTTNGRKR
jgi:hypothetical protein